MNQPGAVPKGLMPVLFAGVLMAALDTAMVGPALPAIERDLNAGTFVLSWVFSAFALATLVATPFMAKLSDRFGRRPVFLLCVVLFAAGSLLVALSGNIIMLLAGRVIQAVGAGGIFPVASAVIGDHWPAEKRGAALGILGSVFGIGFLLGPLFGALLLPLGWQFLFLINLPIAAWIYWRARQVLPAPVTVTGDPSQRFTFDWAGAVLLTVILLVTGIGLGRLAPEHFTPAVPLLLATVLTIGIFAFVRVEKAADDPLLPITLFRAPAVWAAALLGVGSGLTEGSLAFLPSLAAAAFNVSDSQASLLLLPVIVALGALAPVAGRMLDRIGPRLVLLTGVTLVAIGMVSFGLLSNTLAGFIAAGLLTGAGMAALTGAPLRYVLLSEAPAGSRASAQGLLAVFQGTGRLLSASLIGAMAAAATAASFRSGMLVLAGLIALLWLVIPLVRNRPGSAAEPT